MLIQFWKRRKKQCVSIVCSISILFSSIFFLNGCEATFLEEKKEAVKKRRMKDLHRLQKNCFAKRWLQARSVCTIH